MADFPPDAPSAPTFPSLRAPGIVRDYLIAKQVYDPRNYFTPNLFDDLLVGRTPDEVTDLQNAVTLLLDSARRLGYEQS